MRDIGLQMLAEPLGGKLLGLAAGKDLRFSGVSTDTRSIQRGDLFVALHGPNFDGHAYASVAAEKGACALLVERAVDVDLPQLQVSDSLRALGRLARIWRDRAPARVVAITGSNGKTTLRSMLAGILQRVGSVLATRGNLNNEIGLPLTLLRLQDEAYAVVELGANHPGEIGYLSELARPEVAVLNNAGRAHLEGFGSQEGVARAKAEIIGGLQPDGVFVFNGDDRFAPLWRDLAGERNTRVFAIQHPADVGSSGDDELLWSADGFRYRFVIDTPIGSTPVELQLAGKHNRMNALAAAAAALSLGAGLDEIRTGLAAVTPVAGRLCPLPGLRGARLIDDSYNANPDSVGAAIQVLSAAPGRKTLVLGDLGELGEGAQAMHAELGERAQAAGVDRLYSCGQLSAAASSTFGAAGRHFAEQADLIAELSAEVAENDSVLVKGSRTAGMEAVVAALGEEAIVC